VNGNASVGWNALHSIILNLLEKKRCIVFEVYPGVDIERLISFLESTQLGKVIGMNSLYKSEEEIRTMTQKNLTEDVLFGFISPLKIQDFLDQNKVSALNEHLHIDSSNVFIVGTGASAVAGDDCPILYFDLSRWEIIQRFRKQVVDGIGVNSRKEPVSLQYKRGYFNDWKVADRLKEKVFHKVSYWVDTHKSESPVIIDQKLFMTGINQIIKGPFRVVPFFDAAPWGGQWMKAQFDLPKDKENYGWGFDCVPEENSILFDFNGIKYEFPAVNLVLLKSKELLGEQVEARFGKDFPIRFDFLDTVEGGNLSLQVHPTVHFTKENFGLHYTQDESYYMVYAEPDAKIYLGLRDTVGDGEALFNDLKRAQEEGTSFDAEKYVNIYPVHKHDHFLIPSGTIHCSGTNSVVLEISSTPNLFTFKLWDWERLGLDGKPRPINIDRGKEVLNLQYKEKYTKENLVNKIEQTDSGDGWVEEKTGLHPNEFIEVRRHRFRKPVLHTSGPSVNVLNLVEGEEVIVESPEGAFEPFVVHYAETFIIPASLGKYRIRPIGLSEDKECVTVKAYVRV